MNKKEDKELFKTEGELVVDVWENEKEIVVEAPVAGAEKDSLEIVVKENVLKIRGKRTRLSEKTTDKKYLLEECYWGPFSREISLPQKIKEKKVTASLENFILIVKLPKEKSSLEKNVKIKEIN